MKFITLLLTLFAATGGGCTGPSSLPSPSPSPTPTPPLKGQADATALANLDLARQIEKATGQTTSLVWIYDAGANDRGMSVEGSTWQYIFVDRSGQEFTYHSWAVHPNGDIERRSVSPLPGLELFEILPAPRIDSDEAARLALSYGGQAYFDRFPDVWIRMSARFIQRRLVWDLLFQGATRTVGDLCEIPMIIDATSGELLYRDLYCLNR